MPRQFVSFENTRGLTLKGVCFEPANPSDYDAVGFIYLPGIVLGALSVHRLGFKIARILSDHGFRVLVFDQEGIGESEGSYPEGRHESIAHWVAEGNLVGSTQEIVEWARTNCGMERIFLIGHCGGALTAAYCAANQEAVAGAVFISPPPLATDSGKSDLARKGVADEYFSLYLRKLLDPASWKRLFSGGSSYRTLVTVIREKAKGLIRRNPPSGDNYNPHFVKAIEAVMRQHKTIEVLYGEKDPYMEEFRIFHNSIMSAEVPLIILKNTSHGFTSKAAQKRFLEQILDFAQRVAGEQ